MWNAWSYLCLEIATAGAVNWEVADEASKKIRAAAAQAKSSNRLDVDDDDDDDDSDQMPLGEQLPEDAQSEDD